METSLLPLAFVVAFLIGLFYSLAENAQIAVTLSRLEELLPDRHPQEIERLVERRSTDHLHCLVLGLLWNSLFVLAVAAALRGLPWPAMAGLVLLATLVFPVFAGRVFAQTWTSRRAERVFLFTRPLVRLSTLLFGWITWPVVWVLQWLAGAFRLGLVLERPFVLPHDLLGAAVEVKGQGQIEEEEREMIEGIIELRDAEVAEVMTPRTDMITIDVGASVEAAIDLAFKHGHSRIPVYQGNRDNIVGIFYIRDLLLHWKDRGEKPLVLAELMRKPVLVVPETKRIQALLREFQQNKVHMAIVLDEYGGTSGLVTIEDILEEIVGEIEDEYDAGEGPLLRRIDARTADVSAKAHIDQVNEALSIHLPEGEDFETVGGFVFSALGRIPRAGESLEHDNVTLQILEADERKVKRVRILVKDQAGLP